MKDTISNSKISFNCQGILHEFKKQLVMGILNTTPDSFYEESRVNTSNKINGKVSDFINNKVDIIDVGGYSSRPGASHVSTKEEIKRVLNGIHAVKSICNNTLISVDTFRPEVAEIALKNGANIINDITGGQFDNNIFNVASENCAPYIMMHMRGTPQNMQNLTAYENITSDLIEFFSNQIDLAKKRGVKDIIIDPGLGFSKTIDQNYNIIKNLNLLQILEKPILIGASRKSMLYKMLHTTPLEALNATTSINTIAMMNGASILRVHDVKEAREVIEIVDMVYR